MSRSLNHRSATKCTGRFDRDATWRRGPLDAGTRDDRERDPTGSWSAEDESFPGGSDQLRSVQATRGHVEHVRVSRRADEFETVSKNTVCRACRPASSNEDFTTGALRTSETIAET